MKNILVTGSAGQIGVELVAELRALYGHDRIVATDIKACGEWMSEGGPCETLDVTDARAFVSTARKYRVDTIIHLAALLSARAEANPQLAWNLNMGGLMNALDTARELSCKLFVPSSIGTFGPLSPKEQTPQVTIQRPVTMYGVNKAAGELLCDYYCRRFGVDTRGLRLPGLVSHSAPPGGGTTDYAVEMYIEAERHGEYTSYIAPGTFMDMMYMPDAIRSVITLMEADPTRLVHRNAYNVSAMSADPEAFALAIRTELPEFRLSYLIDPVRQAIAESWPSSMDTSAAEADWGFKPKYSLDDMTKDMLKHLRKGSQQQQRCV